MFWDNSRFDVNGTSFILLVSGNYYKVWTNKNAMLNY